MCIVKSRALLRTRTKSTPSECWSSTNPGAPASLSLLHRMDYRQFMKFKREKSPGPFNWNDDGCSGPFGFKEGYRKLFDQPCQLHDFGYRNYGQPKGLKLGRNEDVRKWIDKRFLQGMRRLCKTKLRDLTHPLIACLGMARVVWGQ
jgi:Prokaryotic phospholipase A2